MQHVFLAFFVLYNSLSLAQNYPLSVSILTESGSTMPYVNVQIEGTEKGGTTDEAGKVNFTLSEGRYAVLATYVGYAPARISVRVPEEGTVTIRLAPAGQELNMVTVRADNLRERLERPILGVERLTVTEIEELPAAFGEVDVLRSLQLSSGVNSAGEASNGLSVRGGTVDQNLILLDGAPVFAPTHLFGLFSVFTPDAVGGVDLYRANLPARFGGRVASVVDVRSKTPTADRLQLRGGIGIVSSHLGLETPLTADKRLKLLAAGRLGLNDFAFKFVDRLKKTRSRFGDGTLRLRYTANQQNIFSFSGFYSRDFYQVDLINRLAGVVSEVNQQQYATLNSTLDWLHTPNDRTGLRLRLTHSDYRPEVYFPQPDSDRRVEYDSRIRQAGGEIAINYRSGDRHRLSGGAQLTGYRIDPGNLRPAGLAGLNPVALPREQAVEVSGFIEYEWTVNDRLSLSTGLRYTHYWQLGPGEQRRYTAGEVVTSESLTDTKTFGSGHTMAEYGGLEPRISLNYALHPRLSWKAAYARNRQYLQNIYNATTPLPSSRWKVSDNVIRPQRADLWSSGFFWLPASERYGYSLQAYYRKTTDVLEYRPGADFFLAQEVETDLLQGTGTAYGLEAGISRKQGRVTGEINYAYARTFTRVPGPTLATSVNRGERYPGYFDQPHTANFHVVYDNGKSHRFGFNLVVQSNRPYSAPNGTLIVGDQRVPVFLERNNARLPVYHRLDFNWTIHNASLKKRRWVGDWTFTVYNLYGRNNAHNIYYLPRQTRRLNNVFGSSPLESYRLTIFGAPILSLSYQFKFE
ncbi:TonB-dependent receptor [Lewinella sp. IMCC34191]|uniref:TonB-dependent receptor n=1 Tax=Lewinella sp. IMCC34191 TaxID=2259172 RepID=UPI000E21D4D7|nr:TonB-dependent receptor [Lewinella sp. IMCC34191]